MKQIPILSGKAMIVELPEGAINPHIHPGSNGLWYKYEGDKGGFSYKRCELPPGNWRIIGMLSEVTEREAAQIVKLHATIKKYRDYLIDNDRPTDMFTKTAIESLESAIVSEGYTFRSTPKPENKDFYWGYLDDLAKWEAAQSRVLSRERCLLLRRVDG